MISGFHVGYILKLGFEHDKHFKTPGCVNSMANLFTQISEK